MYIQTKEPGAVLLWAFLLWNRKNGFFCKKHLQSSLSCGKILSCDCAAIAQLVERILGKDEVSSSNLDSSSSSEHLEVEKLQGVFLL